MDIRLEAVHLIGKLLALSKLSVGQEYGIVFVEFLNRFSDKSPEIRLAAIECAKACYMANSSANEIRDILSEIQCLTVNFIFLNNRIHCSDICFKTGDSCSWREATGF